MQFTRLSAWGLFVGFLESPRELVTGRLESTGLHALTRLESRRQLIESFFHPGLTDPLGLKEPPLIADFRLVLRRQ